MSCSIRAPPLRSRFAAGWRIASIIRSTSRSRMRRFSPIARTVTCAAAGYSAFSTTTATARIRVASNRGCAWRVAVGLSRSSVENLTEVLPGVRFAVDAYVNFARRAPWQEAVCSSLTELFAPEIHKQRLANWPTHYPWIDRAGLEYFQSRVSLARRDVEFGLAFTLGLFQYARPAAACTRDPAIQIGRAVADERCDVVALRSSVMSDDAIDAAARPAIERGFRLQWEEAQNAHVLLYPEGMIKLNGSAGRDHETLRRHENRRRNHRRPGTRVRVDRASPMTFAISSSWRWPSDGCRFAHECIEEPSPDRRCG